MVATIQFLSFHLPVSSLDHGNERVDSIKGGEFLD